MAERFYNLCCNLARPFYSLVFPVKVEGLENVPAEGACILCANHLSARDPFYIAVRVRNRYLHFMAKVELFRFPPLAAFMRGLMAFPVDLSDFGRKMDGETLTAATHRIEEAVWALKD